MFTNNQRCWQCVTAASVISAWVPNVQRGPQMLMVNTRRPYFPVFLCFLVLINFITNTCSEDIHFKFITSKLLKSPKINMKQVSRKPFHFSSVTSVKQLYTIVSNTDTSQCQRHKKWHVNKVWVGEIHTRIIASKVTSIKIAKVLQRQMFWLSCYSVFDRNF